MSLEIKPISPLKMKYINMLRERSKDLLSAYNYPDYITSDVELLRFVRGHMVGHSFRCIMYSLTWMNPMNHSVRC